MGYLSMIQRPLNTQLFFCHFSILKNVAIQTFCAVAKLWAYVISAAPVQLFVGQYHEPAHGNSPYTS